MRVADDADRPAAVEPCLQVLHILEEGRNVGADPRSPPRRRPTEPRTKPLPQCRRTRQPERQDDGKGGPKGYDAGKKVLGRKRHILVDTDGLLLEVVVHRADIQDRDGAKLVLGALKSHWLRLRRVWADGGYAGKLVSWVKGLRGHFRPASLEIVKRSDTAKGFVVLPRRWVVERTFGWLGRQRRLSKDYEFRTDTSEAMIRVAMIGLMLRRLAGN